MDRAAIWVALVLLFVALPPREGAAEEGPPEPMRVPAVVVTPSAYTLTERAESPADIEMSEAGNLPLIDNDVLRTAHVFPGVVATDFSARFHLRGSEKTDTLVLLDGMELYEPFHLPDFGGALSVVDLGLVEKARLYMGGFAPRFGDRMGGVFDLESRTPARAGRALVSLDLLNLQWMSEGAAGPGAYLLSVRRGYVDWVLSLIDAVQPLDEKFRPRFFDAYAKGVFPSTAGGDLTVSALFSRDTNLMDKAGTLDDLTSTYDHGVAWARWRRHLGQGGRLDIAPYAGRAERDKREGSTDRDVRGVRYAGVKVDLAAAPSPQHTLGVGAEARWGSASYDYLETTAPFPLLDNSSPPIVVDAELDGGDVRLYAQDAWAVSRRVGVIAGARLLHQAYRDGLTWSPRMALAVRAADPLTLRAAWGRFVQAVEPRYLPVEAGVSAPREPERAAHYILSAEWAADAATSVRTEAYLKEFRGITGRVRDVGRQSQFVFFPLPSSGRSYGAEVFARRAFSRQVVTTAGYAYSVSTLRRDGRNVPRDFDQRHTLLLNTSYTPSDRTALSVGWRYHSGTPVTPVSFAAGPEGLRPVFAEINSARVPPFHSLDARLTRTYRWTRWDLAAYLQVINLYARTNVQEYSYDPEAGYARVEEPFLPITPTFGLVATF
jgi:hypothetical protein